MAKRICDLPVGVKRYTAPWAVSSTVSGLKSLSLQYSTLADADGTATMTVTRTQGGYRTQKVNENAISFNLVGEEVE